MFRKLIPLGLFAFYVSLSAPALAEIRRDRQLAAEEIPVEVATRYASPLKIFPGRSSLIDFRTGEFITFIQLSDPSRLVLQTNAPLESGQAATIVIRPIQTLIFDGQTTSTVPNLIVSTVNPVSGDRNTYIFNLVPVVGRIPEDSETNGIAIIPDEVWEARLAAQQKPLIQPATLVTDQGDASLDDIVRGLNTAIDSGYTQANDPIVYDVLEVLALARNGQSITDAAASVGVDLSVLVALGEIGIEARPEDASPSIQIPQASLIESSL